MAELDSGADQQSTPKPTRQLRRIRGENHLEVYANNVSLQSSIWDFKLEFGVLDQIDPQTVQLRDLATVRMSPQHAKAFAIILSRHVASYEAKFGPVSTGKEDPEEEDDGIEIVFTEEE